MSSLLYSGLVFNHQTCPPGGQGRVECLCCRATSLSLSGDESFWPESVLSGVSAHIPGTATAEEPPSEERVSTDTCSTAEQVTATCQSRGLTDTQRIK